MSDEKNPLRHPSGNVSQKTDIGCMTGSEEYDTGKRLYKMCPTLFEAVWRERSFGMENQEIPNENADCWMFLRPLKNEMKEIRVTTLHSALFECFTSDYDTCLQSSTHFYVKFVSPEKARENVDAKFEFNEAQYRLEYVNHHSTTYVCDDVGGFPTEVISKHISHYMLAFPAEIELWRQYHHGPLVAIKFSEPIEKQSFKLDVSSHRNITFTRRGSICELCQSTEHTIGDCKELVREGILTLPESLAEYLSFFMTLSSKWRNKDEDYNSVHVRDVVNGAYKKYQTVEGRPWKK